MHKLTLGASTRGIKVFTSSWSFQESMSHSGANLGCWWCSDGPDIASDAGDAASLNWEHAYRKPVLLIAGKTRLKSMRGLLDREYERDVQSIAQISVHQQFCERTGCPEVPEIEFEWSRRILFKK
ncbi:hypothetical protein K438DRAFT_1774975 [Mycena galopus ATCC 62051]|nr:hypothetical protein K438DRAFT_1774975 [Mycena galopus ATCC 62051]